MKLLHGIRGTARPGQGQPPEGLLAFYWHFVRQTKGWYTAMFAASLAVALLDTVIPLFIGRLVSLMEAPDRSAAIAEQWLSWYNRALAGETFTAEQKVETEDQTFYFEHTYNPIVSSDVITSTGSAAT